MSYKTVVVLQGEDYDAISDMGVQEMADYLRQWDYGDDIEAESSPPWGSSDDLHQISHGEVLSVNHKMGYAALTYIIH
jgi:hypothetical protein